MSIEGSDCCRTCWFNSSNEGKAGSHSSQKNETTRCIIRDVVIEVPFWTYCANHPHHAKKKISVPIGSVYYDDGYPARIRKPWVKAPDTEEIRLTLLDLLEGLEMEEEIANSTTSIFKEEVIKQLHDYGEMRAIPLLKKLIEKNLNPYQNDAGALSSDKATVTGHAIEALLKVSHGAEIDAVNHLISIGISEEMYRNYEEEEDNFAIIRSKLLIGLKWVKKELSEPLFQTALNDPHNLIRAFAAKNLDK